MQLREEIDEIDVVENELEEAGEEAKPKRCNLIAVQIILCVVIIISVLLLKFVFPQLLEDLKEEYSKYTEEIFRLEDGEIKLIDEE